MLIHYMVLLHIYIYTYDYIISYHKIISYYVILLLWQIIVLCYIVLLSLLLLLYDVTLIQIWINVRKVYMYTYIYIYVYIYIYSYGGWSHDLASFCVFFCFVRGGGGKVEDTRTKSNGRVKQRYGVHFVKKTICC